MNSTPIAHMSSDAETQLALYRDYVISHCDGSAFRYPGTALRAACAIACEIVEPVVAHRRALFSKSSKRNERIVINVSQTRPLKTIIWKPRPARGGSGPV